MDSSLVVKTWTHLYRYIPQTEQIKMIKQILNELDSTVCLIVADNTIKQSLNIEYVYKFLSKQHIFLNSDITFNLIDRTYNILHYFIDESNETYWYTITTCETIDNGENILNFTIDGNRRTRYKFVNINKYKINNIFLIDIDNAIKSQNLYDVITNDELYITWFTHIQ